MANKLLIISDLHLDANDADKIQLFTKFCQDTASNVEQLFILGDLFNFWLGDDVSIEQNTKIIDALKTLSQTTKILIMTGNRDFLLGKTFAYKSGCELINEPYLLTQNNQRYLLIHGDSLCTDDKGYQRMKLVLQNPLTKFILKNLPNNMRQFISRKLRTKSTQSQRHKSMEMLDVSQTAVANFMQKYPNTHLIHGHTHKLKTHKNGDFTRYVLGDWSANQGNAIELENGELNYLKIS